MIFPKFFLKLVMDGQHISLKHLLNSFIYNQKAYIIKIFDHVFSYVLDISKIAHHDLQNI